jgi:hypothetical protein
MPFLTSETISFIVQYFGRALLLGIVLFYVWDRVARRFDLTDCPIVEEHVAGPASTIIATIIARSTLPA